MKLSTILPIPLLFVGLPAGAQAPQPQSVQMVPRPTPDADALAAAMRRLGANPRDLSSLIEAGELSLKLGDATAAASLFKRAELLDPMNGRVKAGMARILVQQERPGEALRFFDQAAGYGLDARSFAGDRGLAYDLIGEQTRAQRDYRLALAAGPQEEVQRRYALSLAISGKRDEALAQIDPLVRQSDRGAWRTRAFILAMGGDLSGATDIATRMMPPGMATGLQPFFKTLPSLGPIDRAFAVHFGEIRPTPARLADARLAPALPALPPEPAAAAPVTLAQAAAPVLRADLRRREARERRQSARDRRREAQQQRVQVARATRPVAAPLPEAPRYGSVNGVTFAAPREVAQATPSSPNPAPAPSTMVAAATQRPATTIPSVVAQRNVTTLPATSSASAPIVSPTNNPKPVVVAAAQPVPVRTPPAARPSAVAPVTSAGTPQSVAASTPTVLAATSTPRPGFSASVPAATPPAPAAAPPITVANAPVVTAPAIPVVAAARPAPASAVAATSAPVAPQMSEDSILARIIAGISIPAEELGVVPARPAPVVAAPAPVHPQPAAAVPRQVASVAPAPRPIIAAAKPVSVPTSKSTPTAKPTPKPTPTVDPKVAARKAAADKKAAEAKKLADAEKAVAAKKVADEKKAANGEPARIWVQVAGGANEGDLAKAWSAAKGKATALNGKQAYSTPLRATNRVVTGPFKNDAEARAMVNTLAKQGVSAFTFTSEAGQKMTKLPPK